MEPPIKPSESDCCNSGCNPCILDVYEEQLKKYNAAIKTNQKSVDSCLSPTSYSIFTLLDCKKHSKDCNLYTFEYVRPEKAPSKVNYSNKSVLYEPGQHLLLRGTMHGTTVQKAYTPIYMENQAQNCFTVLVKLYKNGHMSKLFQSMSTGIETTWRGPYGDFKINYKHKYILFVAQGTGIAPFYSIICDMVSNEECYTFLTLVFCCNSENVLLREELYRLSEYWNFKYELFISGGSEEIFQAKYNEVVHFSRLDRKDIERVLKNMRDNPKVLICGSDIFCENIKNIVTQCGICCDDIIIF